MDRRTMLKSAAAMATVPAALLGTTENVLAKSGVDLIKRAYDAYVTAYDIRFAAVNDEGDYSELQYSPEAAEYDIARHNFYACPCFSMEAVAEKIGLTEANLDLSDDVSTGRIVTDFENSTGYSALSVFFESLRGETIDTAALAANIRAHYAKMLPIEIEQERQRAKERNQARRAAAEDARRKEEASKLPLHPELARLKEEMRAAIGAYSDWLNANPEYLMSRF